MKIRHCFSFAVLLPRGIEPPPRGMPSTSPIPLTWTGARCYIGNPLDSGNSGVFLSIKAWTQHFIVRGRWKIKKERSGSKHRAELFKGKMKAFIAQTNCIAVIWLLHVSKAVVSSIVFYEVLPTKWFLKFSCLHQQVHLGLGMDQKHLLNTTNLQLIQLFSTCLQTQGCRVSCFKPSSTLATPIAPEMHICMWKQQCKADHFHHCLEYFSII